MTTTKRTELKAYVMAKGVKHRCRKNSSELIIIGNFPLGTQFESIKVQALNSVSKAMKSVTSASVHLDLVEIETIDGIDFESWILCDKRHQKQVLI